MDGLLQTVGELTGATRVRIDARLQSLWGGYGELIRVNLEGAERRTAVVKWVNPPVVGGRESSRSHARKLRSYDVELAFYRDFAARCGRGSRVAALLGCASRGQERIVVLEDLDAAGFGARRRDPVGPELDACLRWLACFHASFLGVNPAGLWHTGTYWHLATRPDELAAMADDALRDAAGRIDALLSACEFKTLVHGDAKPANYCFGAGEVAAVDFQYVGGGPGIKDVAYLLCGRFGAGSARIEAQWVDVYFAHLRAALALGGAARVASAVEAEWRALYAVACLDFYRFLAGWSMSAWSADLHAQRFARETLRALG